MLAAALSLFAVACGVPQDGETEAEATGMHEAALLSGPLLGRWCTPAWPGCFEIGVDGNGYMVNTGDACWLSGDPVYSNLVETSTPGTYTGIRYMYGTGVCGTPAPEPVTIWMQGNDRFMEKTASTGFLASWDRASP
jgi:hypothetical protein